MSGRDTTTGVPVHLNRLWLDADLRITTGFVEPHFFAGFSGGPKMVAPGLAGLQTTLTLHDARRIGHPMAAWGITVGNPIHDDVREIARTTGVHFALDVTLNRAQQITAVFAGELFAEHRAACAAASAHLTEAPTSSIGSRCAARISLSVRPPLFTSTRAFICTCA